MNQLVELGYSDVTFLINNQSISAIKSFILPKNEVIRKLIENSNNNSQILIDPRISVSAFRSLLNYYGYGNVVLDTYNIMDLLLISITFKEKTFEILCEK